MRLKEEFGTRPLVWMLLLSALWGAPLVARAAPDLAPEHRLASPEQVALAIGDMRCDVQRPAQDSDNRVVRDTASSPGLGYRDLILSGGVLDQVLRWEKANCAPREHTAVGVSIVSTGAKDGVSVATTSYAAEATGTDGGGTYSSAVGVSQRVVSARPPPNTFILIGNGSLASSGPFTEAQLRYIAEHYPIFIDNKTGAGWNVRLRQIDAQRLRALNPNIKLYSYIAVSRDYTTATHDVYGAKTLPDAWYLHSSSGKIVRGTVGSDSAYFIDLSNPNYRKWLDQLLAAWMSVYDGVFYDNAMLINSNSERRHPDIKSAELSDAEVAAYNAGLEYILADGRVLGGVRRNNIFNGIAVHPYSENRNLALFDYDGAAFNERFCLDDAAHLQSMAEFKAEIDLMLKEAAKGRTIFEKTNYKNMDALGALGIPVSQLSRYCYGAFMMGYTPNYDYYKFGAGYELSKNELTENALELAFDLGAPLEAYRTTGANASLWMRRFQNGTVYVNAGAASDTVTLDQDSIVMNGGTPGPTYTRGARVAIPSHDSFFFKNGVLVRERNTGRRRHHSAGYRRHRAGYGF